MGSDYPMAMAFIIHTMVKECSAILNRKKIRIVIIGSIIVHCFKIKAAM